MNELGRQLIHIVLGLALVAVGALFGKQALVQLLLLALAVGLVLIQLKLEKRRLPGVDWVLKNFERKGVEVPGKGALNYVAGALLLLTLSKEFSFALAGIAILALADGVATIAGLYFATKTKLHWHPAKTWEGTTAFFVAGAIAALPFIGFAQAIAYSLALALIESVHVEVDDNLLIPLSALVLNYAAMAL